MSTAATPVALPDARVPALRGLIDYAGLFPPAALGMEAAVEGFREARGSVAGWIVDRFICPSDRLEDLARVLTLTMRPAEPPWPLSLLVARVGEWTSAVDAAVASALDFRREMDPAAAFTAAEALLPDPLPEAAAVADAARRLRRTGAGRVFFEVPGPTAPDTVVESALDLAAAAGAGAKLRCGGEEPGAFPDPARVAGFLAGCSHRGVPAKATAGLHHPFRHRDDATGIVHHGFLNLLAAAVFAATVDAATVEEIVADGDPASFALTRGGLRWRDLRADREAVTRARESLFVGYGSCDFTEPVADLEALGILPVEA